MDLRASACRAPARANYLNFGETCYQPIGKDGKPPYEVVEVK